jgi:hypothetical protein
MEVFKFGTLEAKAIIDLKFTSKKHIKLVRSQALGSLKMKKGLFLEAWMTLLSFGI